MAKRSWLPLLAAPVLTASLSLGCGSARQHRPASVPQPPPPPSFDTTREDPVERLISESERHYESGQQELERGHLDQARAEFDRALEVLLESPYGARSEPRIRQHFDRLVDRISALEVTALGEGDGFAEKPSEPASIDELLALTLFDTPEATPEVKETVAQDLATTDHDIPIPLNPKVLSYIEVFQGRLRSYIAEGLQRGAPYLPMIQSVFRAEGLPLDLAYIPLIESAFKPNALSRAKAKGVWQFMLRTARANGLRHDWYVDERSDPEKATRAAAKYLKTLHAMFDGDWYLALASYNGGPGRVQRAIKRSGGKDFWSLARSTRYLPRETREYVPMVLAAIVIARNPGQYGFEIPPVEPFETDTVTLPYPVDLRRVAEWTGTSIDQIQALNPELRRWTTPLRAKGYELRVPKGTAELLTARLEESSPDDLATLNWYTVRSGDTLSKIARKLRVRTTDLAEANYLSTRARLHPGQQLLIPRAPAALMAARLDRPEPATAARAVPAVAEYVGSAPTAEGSDRVRLIYSVKRGDTLTSIARLFKTTVAALRRWNHLTSSRIHPGDRLTIYASRDILPATY
ncbi:MAG TPA: LysM peptidoglycan-binding domain-containing protein [Vicinamibacterales bacterium]|nr:LysM peptidoglycan-binding domain-containing protein [Vicinamibacterales bacterium]